MRMGIDIGGTFTDLTLVDEASQNLWIAKVLTTFPDPPEGVMSAIQKAIEMASKEMEVGTEKQ